MKAKWKTIVLCVIVCIISIIIGLLGMKFYHHLKFQKLYKNIFIDERQVVYLGRPSCGYCNLLKPILDDTIKRYNIDYLYINTDWLTDKELDKVLKKLEIRKKTFSTPRIFITEENKIIDQQIGYIDDHDLFHFFKENGIIKKTEKFKDPYPNIERLTNETYFSLLQNQEDAIVIMGRIGDPDVDSMLKYANELDHIKFLSPSVFKTEEEQKKFSDSVNGIEKNTKLPILLEIKNGIVENMIEEAKIEDLD